MRTKYIAAGTMLKKGFDRLWWNKSANFVEIKTKNEYIEKKERNSFE